MRCLTTCRQFQEDAKDASECTWTLSALEALHNALYKFKTYLLTYFRVCGSAQDIFFYLALSMNDVAELKRMSYVHNCCADRAVCVTWLY